jgi:hypothetical protein
MANEMIERAEAAVWAAVAKAQERFAYSSPDAFACPDSNPGFAREVARAAIEAMREPTEAMAKGAWDRADDNYLIPEAVWRAMIDAALSSTPPPHKPR